MSHLSRRNLRKLALCAAGLAIAAPLAASAQSLPYGDTGAAAAPADDAPTSSGDSRGGGNNLRSGRITVSPYIEATQVANAQLRPGNDILTYSTIAAGVDVGLNGRNTQGAVSLRYERRIGWGKASDGDVVSGVARVSTAIIPRAVTIEAGALASRSQIQGNGSAILSPLADVSGTTQTYSVYAGPAVSTEVGNVKVDGHYRLGYTRVESPNALVLTPGQDPVDVFSDSVVHNAGIYAGTRAGEGLPVGVGVGANYYQEDISNLDQRVRNFNARADVTIPVTSDIALVGGVGYEKVRISSRDAVRDVNGNAVLDSHGRYLTDKTVGRKVAYDTSGLIWDAGVMWRPSRRTALEAHVGRRYGSTSVFGSFAYAPSDRTALNVSVYDNVGGFGGQVNNALADMPTQFEAVRNPVTGDVSGCVNSLEKGNCLSGVLGSVRSSMFRARGVSASLSHRYGKITAGLAGGYDRRRFIAAAGTVLAAANGKVDENIWMSANMGVALDQQSTFSSSVYANWFQSGQTLAGDGHSIGATAAYSRSITNHLSATAALGVDGISRETLEDIWTASALVGVRYRF